MWREKSEAVRTVTEMKDAWKKERRKPKKVVYLIESGIKTAMCT